ncbi:MAG: hypothetical protein EPO07_10910, partial [Verrucomicrobia bacterium]
MKTMHLKKSCNLVGAILCAALLAAVPAQAAVDIAIYTFGTTSPGSLASSDTETISTATSIANGSGLSSGSKPANLGNPAWAFTMVKAEIGASQDLNDYISFTVTTTGGANKMMLDGGTLKFDVA